MNHPKPIYIVDHAKVVIVLATRMAMQNGAFQQGFQLDEFSDLFKEVGDDAAAVKAAFVDGDLGRKYLRLSSAAWDSCFGCKTKSDI